MNVGLNVSRSASRLRVSGVWPSTAPDGMHSTSMYRANTWASGMNSSVRESGCAQTSPRPRVPLSVSATKLPCVSTTPFGARRAGRVDDGRDVVGAELRAPALDLGVRDVG